MGLTVTSAVAAGRAVSVLTKIDDVKKTDSLTSYVNNRKVQE